MPSTYSTNLKLTLMATGEQSGTWGDVTNENLGTLLEEAIVGIGTVAMADANQTVTILDGTTSTGRMFMIECTGALTATRTLTVPTVDKNYVIYNNTTGGQTITVKTSAGTGVNVGPGLKRFLIVDGTNVVEAISSVGNLTVAGTLTASATSLGAITATSVNGLTIDTTTGTLDITNSKTLAVTNSLTLSGTDLSTITFPAGVVTVVTTDATQTLTNKTLTSPTINSGALGASSTATTQSAGDNSTKVATTAYVDTAVGAVTAVPAGAMMAYGGSAAPSGWLLCYGQAISRTTYAALFTAIGTSYGTGDGSTTFNVPDARGRVLAGLDNMGGSAASRLTSTTMSPDGQTLGATGGTQTGSFAYSGTTSTVSNSFNSDGSANGTVNAHSHTFSGNTVAASILQPTILGTIIIKT